LLGRYDKTFVPDPPHSNHQSENTSNFTDTQEDKINTSKILCYITRNSWMCLRIDMYRYIGGISHNSNYKYSSKSVVFKI